MTTTAEKVIKNYKKGNQEYKKTLLKRYGVKDFNRLQEVLTDKRELTQAELISKLEMCSDKVKVSFQKQLKENDLFEAVMEAYNNATPVDFAKSLKKTLKTAMFGEERVVFGHHNNAFDKVGRLYFVDENIPIDNTKSYDNRMILITLSNLNWVEINGIKYIKK